MESGFQLEVSSTSSQEICTPSFGFMGMMACMIKKKVTNGLFIGVSAG
jgi:hypothetical protein